MDFRLNIVARARADLQDIFSWIEERSADGAKRWADAFEAAARNVLYGPESYSYAEENEYLDMELREFRFKTAKGKVYRAVFQIRNNEVRILRVRGPGQSDLTEGDL